MSPQDMPRTPNPTPEVSSLGMHENRGRNDKICVFCCVGGGDGARYAANLVFEGPPFVDLKSYDRLD